MASYTFNSYKNLNSFTVDDSLAIELGFDVDPYAFNREVLRREFEENMYEKYQHSTSYIMVQDLGYEKILNDEFLYWMYKELKLNNKSNVNKKDDFNYTKYNKHQWDVLPIDDDVIVDFEEQPYYCKECFSWYIHNCLCIDVKLETFKSDFDFESYIKDHYNEFNINIPVEKLRNPILLRRLRKLINIYLECRRKKGKVLFNFNKKNKINYNCSYVYKLYRDQCPLVQCEMDKPSQSGEGEISIDKSGTSILTTHAVQDVVEPPLESKRKDFWVSSSSGDGLQQQTYLTSKWLQIAKYNWQGESLTSLVPKIDDKKTVQMIDIFKGGLYDVSFYDLIKDTPITAMLNRFAYWKGDLEFKFHINSTPFHIGQLIASFYYSAQADDFELLRRNKANFVQFPHILLRASEANEAILSVPFRYYKSMMPLRKISSFTNDTNTYGRFYLSVMNKLRANSGACDTINVLVYVRFVNAEFSGLTRYLEPQMLSVRKLVNLATDVLDIYDSIPNMDNPPIVTPVQQLIPINASNWTTGALGAEHINVMRLTATGQTPHLIGSSSKINETNINYVVRKWGLVDIISWNTGDTGFKKILPATPVIPEFFLGDACRMSVSIPGNRSVSAFVYPPVSVVSSMFAYWRGSLEIRLDIISSQYQTGSLVLAYFPGEKDTTINRFDLETIRNYYFAQIDVREKKQFIFKIPYIADKPWWPRTQNFVDTSTAISYSIDAPGVFGIFIQNSLCCSSNVPKSADINIYMRAGVDFEVSVPVMPIYSLIWDPVVPLTKLVTVKEGYDSYLEIGSWHYLPDGAWCFRYGEGSDHITQFSDNLEVYTIYQFVLSVPKIDLNVNVCNSSNKCKTFQAKYLCRFIVNGDKDTYRYGTFFSSLTEAKLYLTKTAQKNGTKDPVTGKYKTVNILGDSDTSFFYDLKTYKSPFVFITQNYKATWQSVGTYNPVKLANGLELDLDMFAVQPEMNSEEAPVLDPSQNMLCSTGSGIATFGESFVDLKDLCRRYNLWRSLNIPILSKDLRDKGLVWCKIPLIMNDLMLMPERTRDTIIRSSIHAYVASGYRFFRGGLRVRLVFKNVSKPLIITVQHIPNSRSLSNHILIPTNDNKPNPSNYIMPGYATYVQNTFTNNVISLEIPYYNPSNLSIGQKISPQYQSDTIHYSLGHLSLQVTNVFGDDEIPVLFGPDKKFSLDVYIAVADDMKFSSFCGFPLLLNYSSVVVNSIQPEMDVQGEGIIPQCVSNLISAPAVYIRDRAKDSSEVFCDVVHKRMKDLTNFGDTAYDASKNFVNYITSMFPEQWKALIMNSISQLVHVVCNPNIKTLVIATGTILVSLGIFCYSAVGTFVNQFTTLINTLITDPKSFLSNDDPKKLKLILLDVVKSITQEERDILRKAKDETKNPIQIDVTTGGIYHKLINEHFEKSVATRGKFGFLCTVGGKNQLSYYYGTVILPIPFRSGKVEVDLSKLYALKTLYDKYFHIKSSVMKKLYQEIEKRYPGAYGVTVCGYEDDFMEQEYKSLCEQIRQQTPTTSGVQPESDFLSPEEEDWNIKTSFLATCVTGILSVAGITAGYKHCKNIPDFTKMLLMGIKDFTMTSNQLILFFKNTMKMFKSLYVWVMKKFKYNCAFDSSLSTETQQYLSWIDSCNWCLDSANMDLIRTSPVHVARLYKNALIAEIIQKKYLIGCNKRIPTVETIIKKIVDKRNEIQLMKIAPPVRFEPWVLCLDGAPNAGKSHFAQYLSMRLLKKINFRGTADPIYTRTPGNKFWNGLANQPVCLYDDFLQILAEPHVYESIGEMIALKSSAVFNPPMADLEDKKIRYNPLIVMLCMNQTYPVINGLGDEKAWRRRRDVIVTIRRKEAFKDIDIKLIDRKITQEYKHVEFNIRKSATEDIGYLFEEWKSCDFICDFMEKNFVEFYEHEEINYSKRLKDLGTFLPEHLTEDIDVLVDGFYKNIEKTFSDPERELHEQRFKPFSEKTSLLPEAKNFNNIRPEGPNDNVCPHKLFKPQWSYCKFVDTINHLWEGYEEIKPNNPIFYDVDSEDPPVWCPAEPCPAGVCKWSDDVVRLEDMQNWANQKINIELMASWKRNGKDPSEVMPEYLITRAGTVRQPAETTKVKNSEKLCKKAKEAIIEESENCLVRWLGTAGSYLYKILQFFTSNFISGVITWLGATLVYNGVAKAVSFVSGGKYDFPRKEYGRMCLAGGISNTAMAFVGTDKYESPVLEAALYPDQNCLNTSLKKEVAEEGPYGSVHMKPNKTNLKQKLIKEIRGELASELKQVVITKLTRNTVFLKFVSFTGSGNVLRIVGIKDRYFIIVDHMRHYIKENMDKGLWFLCREHVEIPINIMNLKFYVIQNSALMIGQFLDNCIPLFKNIISLFIRTEDLKFLHRQAFLLETKLILDKDQSVYKTENTLYSESDIKTHRMLEIPNDLPGYEPTIVDITYHYQTSGRGKCMSVLFSGSNVNNPILGFHIAGLVKGDGGFSEGIVQETLTSFFENREEGLDCVMPQMEDPQKAMIQLDTNILPIGRVVRGGEHHLPKNSKEEHSHCYDKIFPSTYDFPLLSDKDPRIKIAPFSPLIEGCRIHGLPPKPFPQVFVDNAIMKFTEQCLHYVKPVLDTTMMSGVVLEEQLVVCGQPGNELFQPLDLTTSEGYPYSMFRKGSDSSKRWLIDLKETPQGYEFVNFHPLVNEIRSIKQQFRTQGITPFTVFQDCLKDLKMPKEKALIPGKTRIFSVSPLDFTVDCKVYLGSFFNAYKNARFNIHHAVGINCDSLEWTDMVSMLLSNSPHIVTGDYSKFGPTLSAQIVMACSTVIINWYKYYCKDLFTIEHERTIKSLFEEHAFSFHQAHDLIYQTYCGAPSGGPFTVDINNMVNYMYLMVMWQLIMSKQNPEMQFLSCFEDSICVITYGDDLIMSVKPDVLNYFNAITLSEEFSKYNITFTDALKLGKNSKLSFSIFDKEASFLKRVTIKHPIRNKIYLGRMDERSIKEICNWVFKSKDPIGAQIVNFESTINQAYSLGPEFVEDCRNKFFEYCRVHNLPYPKLPTWQEMDQRIFGSGLVQAEMEEVSKIDFTLCEWYNVNLLIQQIRMIKRQNFSLQESRDQCLDLINSIPTTMPLNDKGEMILNGKYVCLELGYNKFFTDLRILLNYKPETFQNHKDFNNNLVHFYKKLDNLEKNLLSGYNVYTKKNWLIQTVQPESVFPPSMSRHVIRTGLLFCEFYIVDKLANTGKGKDICCKLVEQSPTLSNIILNPPNIYIEKLLYYNSLWINFMRKPYVKGLIALWTTRYFLGPTIKFNFEKIFNSFQPNKIVTKSIEPECQKCIDWAGTMKDARTPYFHGSKNIGNLMYIITRMQQAFGGVDYQCPMMLKATSECLEALELDPLGSYHVCDFIPDKL